LIPAPGSPSSLNLEAKLRAHTWGSAIGGVIQDFVPGEVTVITGDAIAENTSLTVGIAAFAFEGEVLSCRPRDDQHEVHVAIKDADPTGLRKSLRFPVNLPARLFSSCLETPQPATIIDISGDGLGLQSSVKLAKDATIAIESALNIALGVVKYSRQVSPKMFRSGVTLHHIIARELEGAKSVSNPSFPARVFRSCRAAMARFFTKKIGLA
jgi:hypothetical protein